MRDSDRELTRGQYGPHVRIVCKPSYPPSCDLVVQVRDEKATNPDFTGDTGWAELGRFNDMSDDFAHLNAHNLAVSSRAKLTECEHPAQEK